MPQDALIAQLLSRQQALAEFGSFAFRSHDLQAILDKAAAMCAAAVDAPYCKVCCFRPDHNDLLIEAGFGWKTNVVGQAVSKADATTPGGRAYITRAPVICTNLAEAEGYLLPPFYADHGVVSTVNVIIQGGTSDAPYGILEIDSPEIRHYSAQDITFLTGFANVLAEAVATMRRTEALRHALGEKDMLGRELQHRVRNNLHLIAAMLNMEVRNQSANEDSFRSIANRVQALAAVHEQLLGTGLARSIAFDQYLATLCDTLRRVQPGSIALIPGSLASVTVDLDTATALGIAVTELISNSYKHAFPDGKGEVELALEYQGSAPVLIVQDNGVGTDPPQPTKRHGLGLVQRLVEQVGGSLQIHRSQTGTRCEIVLPHQEAA